MDAQESTVRDRYEIALARAELRALAAGDPAAVPDAAARAILAAACSPSPAGLDRVGAALWADAITVRPADLAVVLVVEAEDDAEDIGALSDIDRLTCSTCRAWATREHLESGEHLRFLGHRGRWWFDSTTGRFRPEDTRPPTPAARAGADLVTGEH